MKVLFTITAAVGLLWMSVPIAAHHSFAAEYDLKQPITLRGTLTKMDWVNPHGWLHVDVKDTDGSVVNWSVEAGGPNALIRKGLRSTDFPVGLQVVIEGYRAKNGTPTANGNKVTFPDGRNFFLGADDATQPAAGGAK